MKKTILMLIFTLFVSVTFAQEEMVSVPKSQLTEQQKQALVVQDAKTGFETASKFVGLGREVGEAVNSGLSALTHHIDTISNTKVGKLTMFLIAYKVIGADVIQFVVGVPLLMITFIFSVIYYSQNIRTRRYVDHEEYDKDGKIVKRNYRLFESDSEDKWGWIIVSGIIWVVCIAIIFAG